MAVMLTRSSFLRIIEYLGVAGVRNIVTPWRKVLVEGCDDTLKHSVAGGELYGVTEHELLNFLDRHGCPCDCSVLGDLELESALRSLPKDLS